MTRSGPPSQRLPEAVAAAVLEFCEVTLAVNPYRVGKPLFGPLAGCHGARRGTYRRPDDPYTLVLKPGLVIYRVHDGYWFWGRPSFGDSGVPTAHLARCSPSEAAGSVEVKRLR